jgi:hypothetical protein
MNQAILSRLLSALDFAVFLRSADGSFTAATSPPPWFPRLADATFPFLGHILGEAEQFWQSGVPGTREYGPVAETDDAGREFHYRVRALTLADSFAQILVFELDRGSERLREVLQTAREQALAAEDARARHRKAAAEILQMALDLRQMVEQLSRMATHEVHRQLLNAMQAKCDALMTATRDIGE